jgi:hypothetical protein
MWLKIVQNRSKLSLSRQIYEMLIQSLKQSDQSDHFKNLIAKGLSVCSEDSQSRINIFQRLRILKSCKLNSRPIVHVKDKNNHDDSYDSEDHNFQRQNYIEGSLTINNPQLKNSNKNSNSSSVQTA